jgi:glucokinase
MPSIVAIDIGGTTVKLALVRTAADGKSHQILIHDKCDTGPDDPGHDMVARIAGSARKLIERTGEKPVGVGVGCPGLIDNKNGIVVVSANLPTLKEFPLAAELSKHLDLPTAIHNDAKAAMLGEYNFGPNRGTQNMVLLTLGTGVGGGVITGGQLVTGADNGATELGHVKVEYHAPALCGCGTRGCLEAYVGIAGIQRIATATLAAHPKSTLKSDRLSTKDLSEAARGGDETAAEVFLTVGHYLGRGIAHFIDIFNPERVVLAGGASRATDLLMPGIRRGMLECCSFDATRDRTQVLATTMPDDINVLGAAAVFLNAQR